jgi:hypothetical protein
MFVYPLLGILTMCNYVLPLCFSTAALLATTAMPAASASNDKLATAVEQFCLSQQKKGETSDDAKKLCSQVGNTKPAVRTKAGAPDSAPLVRPPVQNANVPSGPSLAPAPRTAQDDIQTNSVWIVRRDRSQIFEGYNPIVGGDAPGAAITFTNDNLQKSQTGNFQGFASYTYYFQREAQPGPIVQSAGIAPWVNSSGALALPGNPKKPALSAVQTGIEGQAFVYDILPAFSVDLGASPYYQTDFLGGAAIGGFTFHVRPTYEPLHINFDASENAAIAYRLMLFGEVNAVHVSDPGLTNYKRNTDYAWTGGTAQLRLSFFNGTSLAALTGSSALNSILQDRLYTNATMLYYADANSSDVARKYEVEVGYKLSAPSEGGQSSVSVIYSKGNDISMLSAPQDQVKVQLNYKY